jgi:hypothetical protein
MSVTTKIPPFTTLGLPSSPTGGQNPFSSLATLGATPKVNSTGATPVHLEIPVDPTKPPKGLFGSNAPPDINQVGDFVQWGSSVYTPEAEPYTYTGSDLRVFVDIPGTPGKQLMELTTITVSVHREKAPVRACGYINPKGFARGRRTIAGTMVLTQFYADVLYRFLDMKWNKDLSKDAPYKKPDQLPPFNLTFLFCDEHGHVSYRQLLGVDCVTDGTVYSVQDMLTEQTVSFMASDFTPLLPVDVSSLHWDDLSFSSSRSQKTPKDARKDQLLVDSPIPSTSSIQKAASLS